MIIEALIGICRKRYSGLRPRERTALALLLAVAAIVIYTAAFFGPSAAKISGLKKQIEETNNRRLVLVSQSPDAAAAKLELEKLNQRIDRIKTETGEIESMLIGEGQVPKLLAELVRCAQGLAIDFQSVKQKVEADKDGISRLHLDIKFESSYPNTAAYVKRVEAISPFIKIGGIDLGQSKSDPRNMVSVSLKFSAILAYKEGVAAEFSPRPAAAEDESAKLDITRNPLLSKYGRAGGRKKALKLTGITYYEKTSLASAIINDTVVKAGDEIEGHKIERVLWDSVVLNDGVESKILKVER